MAMKVVRQARLELSGGSTPDQLRPPSDWAAVRPDNQGGYPVEPVRYGHTGRRSPPLAQAEIQTKPKPPSDWGFMVGKKMKCAKGQFWCTHFRTFWFQTPPLSP